MSWLHVYPHIDFEDYVIKMEWQNQLQRPYHIYNIQCYSAFTYSWYSLLVATINNTEYYLIAQQHLLIELYIFIILISYSSISFNIC